MAAELFPCPFCGGEAEVYKFRVGLYTAHCKSRYCGVDIGKTKSEKGAERRWNRRRPELMVTAHSTSTNKSMLQLLSDIKGGIEEHLQVIITKGDHVHRLINAVIAQQQH